MMAMLVSQLNECGKQKNGCNANYMGMVEQYFYLTAFKFCTLTMLVLTHGMCSSTFYLSDFVPCMNWHIWSPATVVFRLSHK